MSIYSTTNNWPPGCSSANQSPVNLSQSGSKPCNLSCDLVMDDVSVTSATASATTEGLLIKSSSLGSCKFRGETYVCVALTINHPSHHTIEGVQADGEAIAYFKKPTGEVMCMSSLFRINSAQSDSYKFFNQTVPYVTPTDETKLNLKDWSISHMVPPKSSYYVYNGSTLTPPCSPCEWVVFSDMITMDQGDFAYLVRNVQAGSRPIQALGDREVFFNNIQNVPGGPMPHDGKFYLRLRPTGNTKLETKSADLKKGLADSTSDAVDSAKGTGSSLDDIIQAKDDYVKTNGTIGLILGILSVVGILAGIYYGMKQSDVDPFKAQFANGWAIKTREFLWWAYNYTISVIQWIYTKTGEGFSALYQFTIGRLLAVSTVTDTAAKTGNKALSTIGKAEDLAAAKIDKELKNVLSTP